MTVMDAMLFNRLEMTSRAPVDSKIWSKSPHRVWWRLSSSYTVQIRQGLAVNTPLGTSA